MSADQPVLDAEHPWPGLFPYGEDAQRYFNGRDRETQDLLRLVRREVCTLLYGQSGLGKSSLLRAGLFPRLRSEAFLPVYMRLDFRNLAIPLRAQMWSILRDALDAARIDGRRPEDHESLWAYFHAQDVELWDPRNRHITPVLVLDQFEEIVQAGEEKAQRDRLTAFMEELADLVENRVPAEVKQSLEQDPEAVSAFDFGARRFRSVISFREDYLAALEEWFAVNRMATTSRLRITKMGESQALEAVRKTGGLLVDETVSAQIVEYVSGASGRSASRLVEIEPALLSVVCFELNNRRLAQAEPQISAALLEGARESIIAEFYQRGISGMPPVVQVFMERELLTESGYRDSCAVEDALQRHGVAMPDLQSLVERRILRLEERFGVLRVELTHDVLAPVVRAHRDQRQAITAAAAQRERDRLRQQKVRRWIWAGGGVAATAVVLMGVFFNMYRRAEAETTRVIQAQSNLFLSRANAALEGNVPGEPYRFLASALELNPDNQGAVARLSNLMVQRRYARLLWAWPMPVGGAGQGLGRLEGGEDDAFAFLLQADRFLVAQVRPGTAAPTIEAGCPVTERTATGPETPSAEVRMVRAAWPEPGAATAVAPARLPYQAFMWSAELSSGSDPAMRALLESCGSRSESKSSTSDSGPSGKPPKPSSGPLIEPMRSLAIEPGGSHIWALRGGGLLRMPSRGTEAPASVRADIDAEMGQLQSAWASHGGRALLIQGTRSAAIYRVDGANASVLSRFNDAGSQSSSALIDAQFDESGQHLLMVGRNGRCRLWSLQTLSLRWERACAGDSHRFVPGRPWLALAADRALTAQADMGVARSELQILQVADGRLLGRIDRSLPINHLAFDPKGSRILVSAQDRIARVYGLPQLDAQGPALLHEGAVVEAHFLPDDAGIVTASFDGSARVWNSREATLSLEPLVHPGPVLFARPVLGGTHLLTGSDDRQLRLWRIRAPQTESVLPRFAGGLVALSPRGDLLAQVGLERVDPVKQPEISVFLRPWSEVPGQAGPVGAPRAFRALSDPVAAIDFNADGSALLITGVGPWVEVAPVAGTPVKRILLPSPAKRVLHVPAIHKIVAQLADDSVRSFDLTSGREAGIGLHGDGGVLDFGVSEDGRFTTVVTRREAWVIDTRTGFRLRHLDHAGAQAAAVHPRHAQAVIATRSRLLLWRPQPAQGPVAVQPPGDAEEASKPAPDVAQQVLSSGGRVVDPGRLVLGLGYSPDGNSLASFSVDGVVTAWSVDALEPGIQIRHSNAVTGLDWSRDGRWLVTRSLDGRARVWDHRSGQLMGDPVGLPNADADFRLMGLGTWALLEDGSGQLQTRLMGLGFGDKRPPNWMVATAAGLAGLTRLAPARSEGPPSASASEPLWWEAWLRRVLQRNEAGEP